MIRLIDAEKLLKELKTSADHHEENSRDYVLMLRDRNIVREQPTVDAIPIFKGVTNGDIIKALFPNIIIYNSEKIDSIYTSIPFGKYIGANVDCMRDWWNAPYKI